MPSASCFFFYFAITDMISFYWGPNLLKSKTHMLAILQKALCPQDQRAAARQRGGADRGAAEAQGGARGGVGNTTVHSVNSFIYPLQCVMLR